MEILMKLKCSPTTAGTAQLSTLKVVDHHRQLQQQHSGTGPQMPLRQQPTNQSQHSNLEHHNRPHSQPQGVLLPSCCEYASAMNCCGSAAASHTHHQPQGGASNQCAGYCETACPPPCCSGLTYNTVPPPLLPMPLHNESHFNLPPDEDFNMKYEYHEPEENFVSIDDAKIKGFLMKIGQEHELNERKRRSTELAIAAPIMKEINEDSKCSGEIVYEIIDLDDEDEREKLKIIKNTAASMPVTATQQNADLAVRTVDISLIPKMSDVALAAAASAKPPLKRSLSKENIIAEIELLDSSSESEAEDDVVDNANNSECDEDDEMPLAATSVSCELECDEDENETEDTTTQHENEKPITTDADLSSDAIVVLHSDDENPDFIDEHEEGLELRWDDLEEEHKERPFFECYLCGKIVQSSYNLRRHMMIHTGERPFSCDLCDRRFREFSDLKKHRRRHINDLNFVCMVCRSNPPTSSDPTRCSSCDTKTCVIIATRPQPANTPDNSKTPPLAITTPTTATTATTTMTTTTATTTTMKKKVCSPVARNTTPVPSCTPTPPSPPSSLTKAASASSPSTSIPLPSLTSYDSRDAQLLLDIMPAVHRPSSNPKGVVTRKEFPCPLCQRPFGTRHNLKRHFMIHTGEKPFSCSKCRKPFREYSTLKKHMVTHRRDRWYKCLLCPKKYRDFLSYMQHKNTHPSKNEEGGEEEDDSNSQTQTTPTKQHTKSKSGYDSHSLDSQDEDSTTDDWLECAECGQRYTDIEEYTEHLKEHDPNLFLYECYICKANFVERKALSVHMARCKGNEETRDYSNESDESEEPE